MTSPGRALYETILAEGLLFGPRGEYANLRRTTVIRWERAAQALGIGDGGPSAGPPAPAGSATRPGSAADAEAEVLVALAAWYPDAVRMHGRAEARRRYLACCEGITAWYATTGDGGDEDGGTA